MCLILESYQAHQKQKESYRTDKIPFVFLQGKSRHEASLSAAPHPTEIPVTLSSKNHHHQKKNSSQSFLKIIRMKFSAPESQKVFYCDALR